MIKPSIQIASLAILIPILIACGSSHETKPLPPEEAPPVRAMVRKAGMQEVSGAYRFPASVTADQEVQLSSKLMGTITWLKVKEGEQVRAGQELVRIKSSDLEIRRAQVKANQEEARAAYDNIERNHARIKALVGQKSATQKELDDISAQLESAKARLEAIRQMELEVTDAISYASIKAPISGTVRKKFFNQGDLAAPGATLLVLEGAGEKKVTARIPETAIQRVAVGDEVTVEIDALEGQRLAGQVERINTGGSFAQAQFEAVIALQDSPALMKKLRTGMYADVFLQQGSHPILLIPEICIYQKGQLKGVFTINHRGEAALRWLRLGKRVGDQVEVLSGLQAGEEYVADCEGRLVDGVKVEVVNALPERSDSLPQ